ncbi:MAG TPA: EpsI family protein [Myxococcota bacterium]|jgi:EpsI family protein
MTRFAVAIAFLALNFYTYHFLATRAVIPERRHFEAFPLTYDGWSCAEPHVMSKEVVANLGVTDYLLCDFVRQDPPAIANVYLGFHERQVREEGGGSGENSIHPPAHCLPGSGWDLIQVETVRLDLPGLPQRPAPVKRLLIAKGEARQLVYYWYQQQGRVIAEDWQKIVWVGLDRALHGRTDGTLVRFTFPIGRDGEEAADAQFRDLAPRLVAQFPGFLPD